MGASSLGIKYTGLDTNLNLRDGYNRMIKDLDIKSKQEMGKLMSVVMKKVKGKADGKTISQLVKEKLF